MRRTLIAAGVALATVLAVAPSAATALTDGGDGVGEKTLGLEAPVVAEQAADQALTVASRVLEGDPAPRDPDASMALLDLRRALPDLSGSERRAALALLARPTNGANDPFGDGYTTSSTFRKCNARLCVHYVKTTEDAAAAGWVDETLTQLTRVWNLEVTKMKYRKPLSDGKRGGDSRFDVYLKDIGDDGLYGYCAAERQSYLSPGFCVLDEDYAAAQYPLHTPLQNLKVTAAHEFFHAVQYAYDSAEDRWLMESTATWMEERYADSVDDNRQYLPSGQLRRPYISLDTYQQGGFEHYGNWVWWEYLSHRYNTTIVRKVWNKAAAYSGAPDMYSTQALRSVLTPMQGFTSHFGTYASLNTLPSSWYPEGSAWPAAEISRSHSLGGGSTLNTGRQTLQIDHMAARNVNLLPTTTAAGSRLKLNVNTPDRVTSPAAVVLVVEDDGGRKRYTLSLTKKGLGNLTVPFDPAVDRVTVTLANASARFTCWRFTDYSCRGEPKDDNQEFAYIAEVLPG